MSVDAHQLARAWPDFASKIRCSVMAQSTWKKSQASMVVAWVRSNCRRSGTYAAAFTQRHFRSGT
jgi:hypothetical protein